MWITDLFFHESAHFLVAAILAFGFFRKDRSLKLILAIFAATFLLDLDHLFDYFNFVRKLSFREFFQGVDFFGGSNKIFIPLHSWELSFFLGIWGWLRKRPLFLAISFALAGHLLVDQLTYTSNPLAYFSIFRAANNFSQSWFNSL